MWKVDKKKHPKLVKTLDIVSFILKIISCICFGIVLLCVVCKCAYDKSSSAASGYISAKADEGVAETALTGDEMNGSLNDFEITNYPSANYFDVTRYSGSNSLVTASNGVVNSIVLLQIDEPVYAVSLATTLGQFCPDLVVGETYTLSFDSTSSDNVNAFRLNGTSNPAGAYWTNGASRVIDASDLSSNIVLYPTRSVTELPEGKFVWSSIMINKGTEVMPYFPYYKSLLGAAYNEGYQAAEYGFLNGSTVDASVKITYGVSSSGTSSVITQDYSAPLQLSDSGFSLSQVFKFYSELPYEMPRSYDFIYFKVKFGSSVNVENFFNSYKFSSSTNAFIKYTTLLLNTASDGTGTSFRSSFEVDSEGRLSFGENNISSTVDLNSLFLLGLEMPTNTYTESIVPFSSYCLVSYNGMYFKGYNNGFNDGALSGEGYKKGYHEGYESGYNIGYFEGDGAGYDEGYDVGYEDGADKFYDVGYDEGKDVGYDEGLSIGFQEGFNQSKAGGFGWLISSVQAFLNVKFFGDFGIGTLLYVGLGITLVTLFLKMFAGG